MPLRVRVVPGPLSGTVKGSCKPVARSISYEVQTCANPGSGQWGHAGVFSDSRNFPVGGLERGKDVFLRVRALGANGPGPWGGPAGTMVV